MMKVDPVSQVILDARFQTFGCGSAIASSSALTELVIGKTIDEALSLSNQDIADFLGGLPPEKMHCSVMGYEALQAAVANYRGETWTDDHEEGALICKCFGIDEGMIERAVRMNRLTTIEAVTAYTKAGGGCLTCFDALEGVLAKVNSAMVEEGVLAQAEAFKAGGADPIAVKKNVQAARAAAKAEAPAPKAAPAKAEPIQISPLSAPPKPLTNLQRIRLVEETIEEVRPLLKKDGGDCELIDVEGLNVFVKLSGACVGCQAASMTVNGIQERLSNKLGTPVRVIPAKSAH
jgi:NifU-like protein